MTMQPQDLRTAALRAPLGLDLPAPDFSWLVPGVAGQVGYALQVAADAGFATLALDTGCVASIEPFGVVYGGAALASCRCYWWRVRLWTDDAADPGPWSEPATFETGILDPALWQARWVAGPVEKKKHRRALYVRGDATVRGEIVRARAYVSALGWYRFYVNGHDLTGPALVPRWTPLDTNVEYQTYDVTDALRDGYNILGLSIGDGRYRGSLGLFATPGTYGDRLAALVQVHVDLADGSRQVIASDAGWHGGPGRIVASDPMEGERVDLRISDSDWLSDPRPPERFAPATLLDERRTLIGETVERVRAVEHLPARSVTRSPSGRQIVDFGQNFAGVTSIRLTGAAGTVVRMTHSEVLGTDGEVDVRYHTSVPTRKWSQTEEVVLDGTNGWWSPAFTIHGFRFVSIEGIDDPLDPADIEGVVLSTDLTPVGDFDCSDPRLKRLYDNVFWSMRSNFTDTPTDCPTRERAGWTGDIQAFAPTAATFMDVQAYLRRYLRNLAIEQFPGGQVPSFIPKGADPSGIGLVLMRYLAGAAGWGDAAVLVPWTLYRYYGDTSVLAAQFESMTRWVDFLARRAGKKAGFWRRPKQRRAPDIERYIVDSGYDFGEWLRPSQEGGNPFIDGMKHGDVVATAYLEHSARVLSQAAGVIGRPADAERYGALADRVRHAWRAVFLHDDGRIGTDRQDDYVRALAFDLLEPAERAGAIDRLVTLIEAADGHLGTGFLSTPMLLPVLTDNGRSDVAWRLLMQTSNPSWLHQVERGATTIWETWEGYKPDGRPKESHNHYAFGAVASFLTEQVVGLAPGAPGYRVIDVRPLVDGPLDWARGSLRTPYGPATADWSVVDDRVTLRLTIPTGTTARVDRGDGDIAELAGGRHELSWQRARAGRTVTAA